MGSKVIFMQRRSQVAGLFGKISGVSRWRAASVAHHLGDARW
jgi:hypothetical protein